MGLKTDNKKLYIEYIQTGVAMSKNVQEKDKIIKSSRKKILFLKLLFFLFLKGMIHNLVE